MTGIMQHMLANSQATASLNLSLVSDVNNYNLKTAALAAGWNGTMPLIAVVTITAGVVLGSTSTSTYSFDTGAGFPDGSKLFLVNNGTIAGHGGNAAAAPPPSQVTTPGSNGGAGGPAFRAQFPITVTNNGTIGGGGGGGASAGNYYDGATNENQVDHWVYGGNGGAGAGRQIGTYYGSAPTLTSGSPATASTVGGGPAVYCNAGAGGNLGAAGGNVSTNIPGFARSGGAAGAAVVGNSYVTWVATGSRYGTIS